jgi:hypothetical protein
MFFSLKIKTIETFLEKWIGKNWREVHLYLHEDSTLMWYSGSDPEGGVLLRDAPEMLAVGQVLSKYFTCRNI